MIGSGYWLTWEATGHDGSSGMVAIKQKTFIWLYSGSFPAKKRNVSHGILHFQARLYSSKAQGKPKPCFEARHGL
jgi:hypothetical protein